MMVLFIQILCSPLLPFLCCVCFPFYSLLPFNWTLNTTFPTTALSALSSLKFTSSGKFLLLPLTYSLHFSFSFPFAYFPDLPTPTSPFLSPLFPPPPPLSIYLFSSCPLHLYPHPHPHLPWILPISSHPPSFPLFTIHRPHIVYRIYPGPTRYILWMFLPFIILQHWIMVSLT